MWGLFFISPLLCKATEPDSIPRWNINGLITLGSNGAIFTNWVAGGETNIGGNGIININADLRSNELHWRNRLELAFGFINRVEQPFEKTNDRLEFTSSFGSTLTEQWNFNTTLNFRTQFAPGFRFPNVENRISDFMAPGFLIVTSGIEFKPSNKFSLILGPTSYRATFVLVQELADRGAFGVRPAVLNEAGDIVQRGQNLRVEFGGFIRASYQNEIMKNVSLQSSINLFNGYDTRLTRWDVQFDNLLNLKINNLFSITSLVSAIYNEDILVQTNDAGDLGRRTQIKSSLVIGLTYTIKNNATQNYRDQMQNYFLPTN
ncbi:MAG: DUF3078 domain-containing protein [Luteibaculaceae bacterium]